MNSLDHNSNQARLARHRSLYNIGLKPLPSALEITLKEALTHLDLVLNGCPTQVEQQAARAFLALHFKQEQEV